MLHEGAGGRKLPFRALHVTKGVQALPRAVLEQQWTWDLGRIKSHSSSGRHLSPRESRPCPLQFSSWFGKKPRLRRREGGGCVGLGVEWVDLGGGGLLNLSIA
jgi:hypothetical protein